ncbi:WhiB family transcriptional regulator [Nocardia wallacei]|uniref:WhiB family transcriptional regulator n=1 Tax=Nocardia wallacei TaxID=480035 RepID=UPI002453BCF5|nr:WhiB family transcriptional regulator [Nocardia wallacei]
MKTTAPIRGMDPASWADRSCRGIDQDTFFPKRANGAAIVFARDLCQGCPRLRECATYAAPLARDGALTEGLIATVLLPRYGDGQDTRDEIADALTAIAEHGQADLEVEGAA